jgi:hypothetical protein
MVRSSIDISVELDLARNGAGPLEERDRQRILAYLAHPTEERWDDIAHIIVNGEAVQGSTIWQAVCQVDLTFPRRGRTTDTAGNIVEEWERIPEPALVARALRFATH